MNGLRYVCIPPVGQPRNGDPRAGYALEEGGDLSFHFVTYDLDKVVEEVRRIGLEPRFCERWVRFLRAAFDAEWSREYMLGAAIKDGPCED